MFDNGNTNPHKKISYFFLLVSLLSIPIAVSLVVSPKDIRLPTANTMPPSPITSPSSPTPTGSQPSSPVHGRSGDANADNRVDGLDYVIWLSFFDLDTPQGAARGDFDFSGHVDGLDYVIWVSNFDF